MAAGRSKTREPGKGSVLFDEEVVGREDYGAVERNTDKPKAKQYTQHAVPRACRS